MDNLITLSIIIPAYNVGKYISNCLDSIVFQTNPSIEIICIDDGSEDDTSYVCKMYAQRYSNVMYYRVDNSGVSSARNVGLSLARGEYVTFVDADDYVEPDYIDTIIKNVQNQEMLLFSHNVVSPKEKTIHSLYLQEGSMSIYEYLASGRSWEVWSKCFRMDIIKNNNIRFIKELKTGEDMRFLLDYIIYVENYIIINKSLYNYRINDLSATHNAKIEYITNYCDNYAYLKDFLSVHNLNSYVHIHEKITFNLLVDAVSQLWDSSITSKELRKVINTSGILKEFSDIEGLKNKIMLFFLNNNMYAFIVLYKKAVKMAKGIHLKICR